ncbi:MAG: hypothetical protein HC837_13015 [Chloroflexaceae bacterium]|nr:hypothetical protein [Chloroflexaceae bacterium]
MHMWHTCRVLFWGQLRKSRNTFWHKDIWYKLGTILWALMLLMGAVMFYSSSYDLVSHVNDLSFRELLEELAQEAPNIPTDPQPLLQAVPSGLLFVALLFLTAFSLERVLSGLYLAHDLEMLLTMPMSFRTLFVFKFFDSLTVPYMLLLALGSSVLVGYGQGMGYGWLYLATVAVLVLLLPILPAALAALLVMLVISIIPARWARDIVSVMAGFLLFGCYLLRVLSVALSGEQEQEAMFNTLAMLDLPLMPWAWAGRALTAAGHNDYAQLLGYGGLFVLVWGTAFLICLWLAGTFYYDSWNRMVVQERRHSDRWPWWRPRLPRLRIRLPLAWLDPIMAHFINGQSRAILLKDFRTLWRDFSMLQRMIVACAFAIIWIGSSVSLQQNDSHITINRFATAWMIFFICSFMTVFFARSGVSSEGRTFWLLKLAPINPRRLLFSKLVLAYTPFLLIGTLLSLVLTWLHGHSLYEFFLIWMLILVTGLGTTCIEIGFSAMFPRFDWENPMQQHSRIAGCLSTTVSFLYIGIMVMSLMIVPSLGYVLALVLTPASPATASWLYEALVTIGWVVAFVVTALVVWSTFYLGSRGIERVEL